MSKIVTFENNSQSLSCKGEIEFDENNVIKYSSYKGYPRADGIDRWLSFYENAKQGDTIRKKDIDYLLGFNGRSNIKSICNYS